MKPKISFLQKIFLIAFGILCFVIILEISLRLGGLAFSSLQRHRNLFSLKQKNAYRILCLGESTTAGQYPAFLEGALNSRNTGTKFSVIDKGIPGTTTSHILDSLESTLDSYCPDMVVTMMGINDFGPHMPHELDSDSKALRFLKSFRVYKMAKLVWLHITTRHKELKLAQSKKRSPSPEQSAALNPHNDQAYLAEAKPLFKKTMEVNPNEAEALFKKAMELNPHNDWAYVELGWDYRNQGRFSEAETLFKKAIELNSHNDWAYIELALNYRLQGKLIEAESLFKKATELNPKNDRAYVELALNYRRQGRLAKAEFFFKKAIKLNPNNDRVYVELALNYRRQGKLAEAESLLKKAVELNPGNDTAYIELGWDYRSQGKFSEAEALFKKAIELNPNNDRAHVELGGDYRNQGKLAEAEAFLKKAIELNPNNDWAYVELGWDYRNQGKLAEAEALFKKAIELNPHNVRAYIELGWNYRSQGKLAEAESSFKKAVELNPNSDRACGALKTLYMDTGNSKLARKYDIKAQEAGYYPLITVSNYQKFKAVLDKRGIKYACAQYPMRNIEPLKKIFQGNAGGIVFVDNEKVFRDAVNKEGFNAYFIDMFGGDFGHCTDKGNALLAENIAREIVKDLYCFPIYPDISTTVARSCYPLPRQD